MPKTDTPEIILPSDPCIFCAEKHFATAWRIANEYGYVAANRAAIIGELVLCQWHLWKTDHLDLCEKVRDIRHAVQQRREAEVDWLPALAEMDALATEESKKHATKG